VRGSLWGKKNEIEGWRSEASTSPLRREEIKEVPISASSRREARVEIVE